MARPLQKTYSPEAPYVVRRRDNEDGSISYEVFDERPESYRFVCAVSESYSGHDALYVKHDAEQIAYALNFAMRSGFEKLPKEKASAGGTRSKGGPR